VPERFNAAKCKKGSASTEPFFMRKMR